MPQAVDRVILRQVEYRNRLGGASTLSEALIKANCRTFASIVDQHLRSSVQGTTTAGIAASVEPATPADPNEDATEASSQTQSHDERRGEAPVPDTDIAR